MHGFVDLTEAVPGVLTEVRYATGHNLTGHPLAGYTAPRALATREAAQALAVAFAQARRLGYGMLVYDAYRPQKAVDDFVRWSRLPEDGTTREEFYPRLDKGQLFPLGYIALRSGHSRGSTIDLTLTDASGRPVDMGGGFDLMVLIEGKTLKEVALFVAQKLAVMEAVSATATHFVLKKYKDKGVIFTDEPDEDKRTMLV